MSVSSVVHAAFAGLAATFDTLAAADSTPVDRVLFLAAAAGARAIAGQVGAGKVDASAIVAAWVAAVPKPITGSEDAAAQVSGASEPIGTLK